MKYRFKPSDTDGKATRRPLKALGAVKITYWWKKNRLLNQKSLNNEAEKCQNKDSDCYNGAAAAKWKTCCWVQNGQKTLQLRHKQAEKSKHGPRNQKETKSTREIEKYWAETIRKTCLQAEKISKTTISKKRAESDINEKLNRLWPTNQPKASKAARCDRKVTEISNYGEKTHRIIKTGWKKAWVGITGNRKRENDEKKRGGKNVIRSFFSSSSEWQQIARFSFSPRL